MEEKKMIPIGQASACSSARSGACGSGQGGGCGSGHGCGAVPRAGDEIHERLEGAGFMRMMGIGEPQLSQFVDKYKAKGYEVEVVMLKAEAGGQEILGEMIPAADIANSAPYGTIYVRKVEQ